MAFILGKLSAPVKCLSFTLLKTVEMLILKAVTLPSTTVLFVSKSKNGDIVFPLVSVGVRILLPLIYPIENLFTSSDNNTILNSFLFGEKINGDNTNVSLLQANCKL